jgi:5-methylcytosine-specific restriction endonuclease McrBC GTP-binding regulatory subunit McrB
MAFDALQESISFFTKSMESFAKQRTEFEALRDKEVARAARVDTKILEDQQELLRLEQAATAAREELLRLEKAATATKHRIGYQSRNALTARKLIAGYEMGLDALAYAAAETKRHLDLAAAAIAKPLK